MSTTPLLTRRRHPRIEIDGTRPAQDLTHGHWVQIRNISPGGFLTTSPRAAQAGETHTFRAVLRAGESSLLRATAVHCHPAVGKVRTCVIGWQAASDGSTVDAMQELINDITTADATETPERPVASSGPDCA